MEKQVTNPVKVIRLKCLDCCCGSPNEVKMCTATGCPLHPFRDGKNPYRAKRQYTPEQIEARVSVLRRNSPTTTGKKNENSLSEGKDTTANKRPPQGG